MGINWASFYLKKVINLDDEKKKNILSRPAISNLSIREVRRIVSLGDPKKINLMVAVYASNKFNDEEKNYTLTDEEKQKVIEALYAAKGDEQFDRAGNLFITMASPKKEKVIAAVSLVSGAEHGFQSKYSSFVAQNKNMQRHDNFIRIVKILTLLDKYKAMDFYEFISLNEYAAKDTRQFSKLVDQQLKKYEALMSEKVETIDDSGIGEGEPCGSMSTAARKKQRKKKRVRR